jgi:hypothetical protein
MLIVPPFKDKVISETPYIRLLTEPKLQDYELLPGFVISRWEAVAVVNFSLCLIEVSVSPHAS